MPLIRSPRFRYTLRALLVFVTLFCLWGGYHANRAIRERQAAEVLIRHKATFATDPIRPSRGALDSIRLAYQGLVQLVWRERFITHVSIATKLEPEVVNAVIALPHLESLSIEPVQYSLEQKMRMNREGILEPQEKAPPGAIGSILRAQRLSDLALAGWILSDEDCRAIARHDSLISLQLIGCGMSEDGFARLVALPKLQSLRFSYSQITGAGLAALPGSNSLENIECYFAPIGNEFAAFVARCPKVATLSFFNPAVDDLFVAQLGAHPSLTGIDLSRTIVTDRSLPVLERMPSLRVVGLPRATVTAAAVDRLQHAKPNLKISRL
jgi:hypothetical protein